MSYQYNNTFDLAYLNLAVTDCLFALAGQIKGAGEYKSLIRNRPNQEILVLDGLITILGWLCSEQPIRSRYLGHVTIYQPIRDQYFLMYVVDSAEQKHQCGTVQLNLDDVSAEGQTYSWPCEVWGSQIRVESSAGTITVDGKTINKHVLVAESAVYISRDEAFENTVFHVFQTTTLFFHQLSTIILNLMQMVVNLSPLTDWMFTLSPTAFYVAMSAIFAALFSSYAWGMQHSDIGSDTKLIWAKQSRTARINPVPEVLISLSTAFQPRVLAVQISLQRSRAHTPQQYALRVAFGSLMRAPTNHSLVD
eukprot:sb/3467190/